MSAPSSPAAFAPPGLAPGTLLADRYRIQRALGEGGMGAVYLAEHVLMRKDVAVKVLHADLQDAEEVMARFEREAIAAAHIAHPNVAQATDFGRLPDGSCFLVLEYIDGTSLRKEIGKGALDPARAVRIARGILSGVGAAHAKGIVHRDLKPENVMLVPHDGEPDFVKVLDFGIAKVDPTAEVGARSSKGKPLTKAGTIFGTPDYMSPEQALGDPVDLRADLYAIGVMLFEMLTGERPFKGGLVTILSQRVVNDAPQLPEALLARLPPRMSEVVARLLARMPAARFSSAGEVLAALDGASAWRMPAAPNALGRSHGGTAMMPTMPAAPVSAPVGSARTVLLATPAASPRALPKWLTPLRVAVGAGVLGLGGTLAVALAMSGKSAAVSPAGTASSASLSAAPSASVEMAVPMQNEFAAGLLAGSAAAGSATPTAAPPVAAAPHPTSHPTPTVKGKAPPPPPPAKKK